LRGADDSAVAQEHTAFGLIDGVPASQCDNECDNTGDSGRNNSSDHGRLPSFG
jgi:hypothetical protein